MTHARLGGSLAGDLAGSLSGSPVFDVAAALGADLLNWWEPTIDVVTFNGPNVSAIADRGAAPHDMSQATAANQPLWVASGGPNNRPYVQTNDTSDGLTTGSVLGLVSGHRTGWYAVIANTQTAAEQWAVRITNAAAGVRAGYHALHSRQHGFVGGSTSATITSPANNTAWHLHAFRPLDTGALYQIDGVTSSPAVGRSDGLAEWDIANIGRPGGFSGGKVACLMLVTNPTAAKDAAIRAYMRQRFRLPV